MKGRTALIFSGLPPAPAGAINSFYESHRQAGEILNTLKNSPQGRIIPLMLEGPDEELSEIQNSHVAVFITGMMIYAVIKDALGEEPLFIAGYGPGEYAAAAASGAVSFEDALKLVSGRAALLRAHMPEGKTALVKGMLTYDVVELCRSISESGHLVEAARFNSRKETVISGTVEGIEIFQRKSGADIIPLSGGPLNCFLMRNVRGLFAREAEKVYFSMPSSRLVMNFSGRAETEPAKIAGALVEQISSPIKWVPSVEFMVRGGAEYFIECGWKSVLSRLIRDVAPEVKTVNAVSLLG